MSNLVDRYLLFRIRTKRDPDAFAKIYDRYVEALYRFTLLKLPSVEEAQDITAETFTKTWHFLQENREVKHIRALLYRIARNLIADYYRQLPTSKGVELVRVTIGEEFASNVKERGSDPREISLGDSGREREAIEARAELSLIIKQLERLKEDYRDVVTLRLVDGLAFEDIAAILGKKRGNVRVIFHRAMKTLRELGL